MFKKKSYDPLDDDPLDPLGRLKKDAPLDKDPLSPLWELKKEEPFEPIHKDPIDFTPKVPKIEPSITYEPPQVDCTLLGSHIKSPAEEEWDKRSIYDKTVLSTNGITPSTFESEKKRHNDCKNLLGNGKIPEDDVVLNRLDEAFKPSPLDHSFDDHMDMCRGIMAADWAKWHDE